MMPQEPNVPHVSTLANIRKGRTLISLAPCFASCVWLTWSMRILCLVLCFMPHVAHAADSATAPSAGTVLVVFEPGTQAASERLRQEIESLGFAVQLVRHGATEMSLDTLAAES